MANRDNCMHGLVAEFTNGEELVEAAKQTHAAGYTKVSAYSPYYVHGLSEAMEEEDNPAPYFVVVALLVGALIGFGLQYYTSTVSYEFNIGGRPLNSWPSFMLITFELGILFAALTAVGYMFLRIGLPLPYHPIFNAPNIEVASRSGFFLCIETGDRNFHLQDTRQFLQGLEPIAVSEVGC